MDQVISKILYHISTESQKEHKLSNEQLLRDVQVKELTQANGKSIAFIDGGNCELLNGTTFCLQLIRIACVVFSNGKKKTELSEFYLFSTITQEKEELCFLSTIFPLTGDPLITPQYLNLSVDDKSIAQGLRLPTANSIGGIARRFAELAMAFKIQDEVDLVLLDGNLEKTYTHEEHYLSKLKENVSALAKTTTMMSKQGGNIAALLNVRQGIWQYELGVIKGTHTSFVKLHPHTKYVFMLQSKGENIIADSLVSQSRDPLFLGYPYGLIYADKMARISNHEKNMLLTKLKVKFGQQFKEIEKYVNTKSAHDVLDSMG